MWNDYEPLFIASYNSSKKGQNRFKPRSARINAGSGVDSLRREISIKQLPFGAFVYRLGHGPLKAERRVRFPYALPTLK